MPVRHVHVPAADYHPLTEPLTRAALDAAIGDSGNGVTHLQVSVTPDRIIGSEDVYENLRRYCCTDLDYLRRNYHLVYAPKAVDLTTGNIIVLIALVRTTPLD